MSNYFYEMLKPEDRERLPYLPTIVDLMKKCVNDYAELPAISDKTTTYTYKELYSRVARRRAFLYGQGIEKGAKVAVMARNDLDAMELYLAVTTAGYTLIMLPNALGADALKSISVKFELAAMFVADEFRPLTEGLPCEVFAASSIGDTEADFGDVKKDTVAAIYFTGGTTGAPKGAVLNHGALMRGSYNGVFRTTQIWNNRYIAMLPLSHIFGSVMGFLSCLYTGSLIYTCTDMKAAVGDIPVVKPTCLILVPGLVEIILNIARVKGKAFLGDLNSIMCGAAPVPPRLMAMARDYGINVLAGYGLTEGANLTCGNCNTDIKPDSMGHIYPEQEYKVVDGELWIKGDNVMNEYYKEPEKTAEVFEDGWFKTGDLVHIDEEGWVYITGRIKNLIILPNGENVSPEEIEELFYKHSEVKDCMVREMDMNGNTVVGIEILPFMPELADCTLEQIEEKLKKVVDEVNAALPPFKRVLKLLVRTEDFKRTGSLKIARN